MYQKAKSILNVEAGASLVVALLLLVLCERPRSTCLWEHMGSERPHRASLHRGTREPHEEPGANGAGDRSGTAAPEPERQ